jgi:hypothetical protein
MPNKRKHAGDRPLRPPRAARRPEFDVMRALVVAGLVVFHSAMVFASSGSSSVARWICYYVCGHRGCTQTVP